MKITIEGAADEVAEFVKAITPSEVFLDSTNTVPAPIHLGVIPHGDGPLGTPGASEPSPGPTTAS